MGSIRLINDMPMGLYPHYVTEYSKPQNRSRYIPACPICTPQDKLEILKAARKIYSADEWERRVQLVNEGKK